MRDTFLANSSGNVDDDDDGNVDDDDDDGNVDDDDDDGNDEKGTQK